MVEVVKDNQQYETISMEEELELWLLNCEPKEPTDNAFYETPVFILRKNLIDLMKPA